MYAQMQSIERFDTQFRELATSFSKLDDNYKQMMVINEGLVEFNGAFSDIMTSMNLTASTLEFPYKK
eukprot:Awhi_evm1s5080